jgi:ribonuclease HII
MASLDTLLKKPIPELRERFLERGMAVPAGLLEALENDGRQAARELARRIRDLRKKNRAEGQRLRKLLEFETDLWDAGTGLIAGVDEAGMAPLAGPVVAGAVILKKGYRLRGLDDSKKILDEAKRDEMAVQIKADAVSWAVGIASVEEVDALNIYHAGLLAMRRAVEGLGIQPEHLLVDARTVPGVTMPQKGIIGGDALSLSIAAASIIAKTTRDAMMVELDALHPGYGLARHKGYPTPEHCRLLAEKGALPIHRRSFARVRQALGLDPVQLDLTVPDSGRKSGANEACDPS